MQSILKYGQMMSGYLNNLTNQIFFTYSWFTTTELCRTLFEIHISAKGNEAPKIGDLDVYQVSFRSYSLTTHKTKLHKKDISRRWLECDQHLYPQFFVYNML